MKRLDLLRWLDAHGCSLLREGGRHSVYVNRMTGKSSTVPRHREIDEFLARKSARIWTFLHQSDAASAIAMDR